MVNLQRIVSTIFFLILSQTVLAHNSFDKVQLETQAKAIVKKFAGQLKPKLKAAIQAKGFKHAVEICSVEAPNISKKLSQESGWLVKRVSLKARNNKSAQPNAFEQKILEQFEHRQAQGEPAGKMAYSGIVDNEYKFLKAQPVQGLCLNCHGKNISAEIKQILAEKYPQDNATGYQLGEIRGAFSLSKTLN